MTHQAARDGGLAAGRVSRQPTNLGLRELGQIGGLRASLDILKLFKSGVFKTKVASVSGIEDYPAALDAYAKSMTDGKALLKFS